MNSLTQNTEPEVMS